MKAKVNKNLCVGCEKCLNSCTLGAISIYKGSYAIVNNDICTGCGKCLDSCVASLIELLETAK